MDENPASRKNEILLLRAEKIGLLELNIQAINIILEQYQTELAQENALVEAQLRKEAGLFPKAANNGEDGASNN